MSLRAAGRELGSEQFAERARAQFSMRSAGEMAAEVLAELSKAEDPETRRSAISLQAELRKERLKLEETRPRSREHAAMMVEKFWPPEKLKAIPRRPEGGERQK